MFSTSYRAAAVQMNSQTDLESNLDQAYTLIKKSSEKGARVTGLPENFAFFGGLSKRINHADEIAERVPSFLAEAAKEFDMYLIGGSFPIPTSSSDKVYNHTTMYGPEGEELASYNKIHLFDANLSDEESYRESDYIEPGTLEPVVYKNNIIGNWGLTVCYDMRFPELFRQLIEQDAEILSIPSAFTYTTGQDHWKSLLRSRAIENTSYVFAPAQTGAHGKNRKTWGHAMIIDPWGRILADAGQEPGIALAEIDPEKIQEVRRKIPSLQHRRF
jgi:predicted amidohydrolase